MSLLVLRSTSTNSKFKVVLRDIIRMQPRERVLCPNQSDIDHGVYVSK